MDNQDSKTVALSTGLMGQGKLHPGLIILLILSVTPGCILLAMGRTLPGIAAFLAPVALYLVTSVRSAFYLFMLSVSVYLPYHLPGFAIHTFDIGMALLFASLVADFLLHGRTEIRKTGMDVPFILLIIATWISAVFAFNYHYSVVPSLRIVVIYLAFRAVFNLSLEIGIKKVVLFYIYHVLALAVINCVLFAYTGGSVRVFGPAWLAFETYSMTALPMALCFYIWAKTQRERAWFAIVSLIILIAIFATQSRAPLLAVTIAIPTLAALAFFKTKREKTVDASRSARRIIVIIGVASVLVIFLGGALFTGMLERSAEFIDSLSKPKGTVALRIVLWTAAIKGFLTDPITGIGIGNYRYIDQLLPEMKTVPVWYYIRGMTAHNVILQYLCETGIIGVSALLLLTGANFRMAYRSFRAKLSAELTPVAAAIFIANLVFTFTIFYMRAWTWGQGGYIMVILFGLNAAFWYQHRPDKA